MKKPIANLYSPLFLILGLALVSPVHAAEPTAKTKDSTTKAAEPAAKPVSSMKLHRVDFRVTGASCVACLRRVGKTMREQKGVLKGDVSIFKPYWSVMIYDAEQINTAKIFESVAKEKVKIEDIEDKPIASMPLIVIPKRLNTDAPNTANAAAGGASNAGPAGH